MAKAVMARSRLKISISKIEILLIGITTSINKILALTYSEKKYDYFRNLNVKNWNDKKKFWKIIKSFFSDKCLASRNIVLKEKGNLTIDNKKPSKLIQYLFHKYHQYFTIRRISLKT